MDGFGMLVWACGMVVVCGWHRDAEGMLRMESYLKRGIATGI